jgi:hypothetical protein
VETLVLGEIRLHGRFPLRTDGLPEHPFFRGTPQTDDFSRRRTLPCVQLDRMLERLDTEVASLGHRPIEIEDDAVERGYHVPPSRLVHPIPPR